MEYIDKQIIALTSWKFTLFFLGYNQNVESYVGDQIQKKMCVCVGQCCQVVWYFHTELKNKNTYTLQGARYAPKGKINKLLIQLSWWVKTISLKGGVEVCSYCLILFILCALSVFSAAFLSADHHWSSAGMHPSIVVLF